MGLFTALRSAMTLDPGVSTLVSARVYADQMPDNLVHDPAAYPAIVLHQISRTPTHSHGGVTAYAEYRFQINLWAKDHDGAEELGAAVRALLDGFKGDMPATGTPRATVESAFLDGEDFDVDDGGDGRSLHICRQDYLIAIVE